jgi:hypothetical protein
MRRVAVGMSLVAMLSVTRPVLAQPEAVAPAAAAAKPSQVRSEGEQALPSELEPEPRRTWYGWQTLLADGLSLATVVLIGSHEGNWYGYVGFGMLLIGSPIVHFANLNVSSGLSSLAIRTLSAGSYILGALSGGGDDPPPLGMAMVVAGMIGLVTAVILDAAVLGWKERPRQGQARASLAPWIDPASGHAGLLYTESF